MKEKEVSKDKKPAVPTKTKGFVKLPNKHPAEYEIEIKIEMFTDNFYNTLTRDNLKEIIPLVDKGNKPSRKFSLKSFSIYTILGESPYTRTLLAIEEKSQKHVCIKYYKKWLLTDHKNLTILEDMLEKLKDTNEAKPESLISIEGLYDSKPFFFLVTDFKKGGDLLYQLRRFEKFSEESAYHIIKPIVESMCSYHASGKIIMDLKPENILIDKEGNPFINIYSSLKFNMIHRNKNKFGGSIDYFPPEVFSNGQITKALDYWGLGILIYELITGVTPFQHDDIKNTKLFINKLDVYIPNIIRVSDALKDLLKLLLEKDPNQRLENFGESTLVDHAWFGFWKDSKMNKKEIFDLKFNKTHENDFFLQDYKGTNKHEDLYGPNLLFQADLTFKNESSKVDKK